MDYFCFIWIDKQKNHVFLFPMEIQFDKYQGAGNDFIIMDNRSGIYDLITTSQFHSMCNRFKGIGADGVILIE